MKGLRAISFLMVLNLSVVIGYAQFSSNLQGVVSDASGAVISQASIVLTNTATSVSGQVQTGDRGEYRFSSLAPGDYDVVVSANGFATSKTSLKLLTNQTMNLPVTLTVSGQSQSIQVTDRAPVLDTADSRTQLTIDAEALQSLPLPGRNLLGLTTLAPGVTGLGLQGDRRQRSIQR